MKDPTLQRIGADRALIKRAVFLSNTSAESPRRTLAVKTAKTHWMVFMKPNAPADARRDQTPNS